MSLKYTIPAILAVAGAASAIHAQDGGGSDLRLEAILLPEDYDYDATADGTFGPVSIDGDGEFDQPFRVGVAAVGHGRGVENGPLGLVGGAALYYTRLPVDDDDSDERYEALSAQVRLGLGIYVGDFLHLEATPFAGIGAARGKINGSESDTGLYWEYGISAGAFVSPGGSFQLGLIGGWLRGEYDLDFDEDDNFSVAVDNVNAELTHEGFFIGLSLGSRL